jgi:hypothetical protein
MDHFHASPDWVNTRAYVSSRNRALVEGALLADIAVVLLLGRVYLPIPIVRTLWRFLAGVPFVLLMRRQGLKTTLMAGLVTYVLLSVLTGPILALPALDTLFAALIVSYGIRWRLPKLCVALAGGALYAVFDVVAPTIAFMLVLRVPLSIVIGDIRTSLNTAVKALIMGLTVLNHILHGVPVLSGRVPLIRTMLVQHLLERGVTFLMVHWIWFALGSAVIYSIINVYGYGLVADLILDRLSLPDQKARVTV